MRFTFLIFLIATEILGHIPVVAREGNKLVGMTIARKHETDRHRRQEQES
jgi:hypothetical protein